MAAPHTGRADITVRGRSHHGVRPHRSTWHSVWTVGPLDMNCDDTIRYDMIYLRASNSWRIASLVTYDLNLRTWTRQGQISTSNDISLERAHTRTHTHTHTHSERFALPGTCKGKGEKWTTACTWYGWLASFQAPSAKRDQTICATRSQFIHCPNGQTTVWKN